MKDAEQRGLEEKVKKTQILFPKRMMGFLRSYIARMRCGEVPSYDFEEEGFWRIMGGIVPCEDKGVTNGSIISFDGERYLVSKILCGKFKDVLRVAFGLEGFYQEDYREERKNPIGLIEKVNVA